MYYGIHHFKTFTDSGHGIQVEDQDHAREVGPNMTEKELQAVKCLTLNRYQDSSGREWELHCGVG
jgi:hypothetical protein